MSLRGTLRRAATAAFTTSWPATARFLGTVIGATELLAWVIPPHQAPSSGLLGFAASLFVIPNAVDAQAKRHKTRDSDDS